MLSIKNLTIFINDKKYIDQLNLVVNKQDKMAIIGEEGNGKSTLLKAIINELEYATIRGEIQTFQNKIGYLEQIISSTDCNKLVREYLFVDEDDFFNHMNELYTILPSLQLSDDILDKKIAVLSGGEKVKVQLLNIVLGNPDIILLDEPTNDLDIETLQWLEKFILSATKPILFISHDETLLSNTANKILHLEQLNKQTKCKHTLFKGSYDDYLHRRYQKIEKDKQIAHKEKEDYLKKKEKLNTIKNAIHDALNDTVRNPAQAALLKKKMASIKAMDQRFEKEGYSQVDSIEENITLFFDKVQIPARKKILDYHLSSLTIKDHLLSENIHLEIYGAKHIVLIGKNGCGKTTLLNAIYKEIRDRDDIKVGYMPQDYDSILKAYKTPLDYLCPDSKKETITIARKCLGNLNFTRDEMTCDIDDLSSGTKAKLILLHLIMNQYDVLLLDEPTRNVSPLSNPVIRNALLNYQGCIISVSHDRKYINEVCDQVYTLDRHGLHKIDKDQI